MLIVISGTRIFHPILDLPEALDQLADTTFSFPRPTVDA